MNAWKLFKPFALVAAFFIGAACGSGACAQGGATPAGGDRVTYIHTDALGSPVARTDAAGNLVSRTSYEPYGATASGVTPTIGFTGHVNDARSGLVYMQQRYYDPVAGRFLSTDPVTTDANSGSSFNRYVYANDNPYKHIDPDGRANCTVDANGCKHFGTPQKTGTPGHDTASAKVGAAYSKQGATEVHYHRSLAAVTGNLAAGTQKPDVAAVMPSGKINTAEIISPSQTTASQVAKGTVMQAQLPAIGKGGTAQTYSISQGLAVKSVGALSVFSAVGKAYDLQQIGGQYGKEVSFVTGFGYMAGALTREQVIQSVDPCPPESCI